MKKIVVVLDGLNYSSSAVAYAVFIAQQEMAHLVGVFPEDFTYRSYALYDLIASMADTLLSSLECQLFITHYK